MNANQKAFLDMIAVAEGTKGRGDDGYNVLFGGKLFDSYADHPRVRTYETHDEFIRDGKRQYTSAAGRYQITATTFDAYKKLLKLDDFSPASQDAIALQMIRERRALRDIDEGRLNAAIVRCSRLWASFPGAGYGQRERSLKALRTAYKASGGTLSPDEAAA